MKPVAIFRHAPTEGPGYFATFLDRANIPWRLIRIDAGEETPASAGDYSGLCFMGGPMSVHDDLPWIPRVLALIRQAIASGVPVIGHCLGGQLMAKALGADVRKNHVKEIGWGEVTAIGDQATLWLGETDRFPAFHWHGETFAIPAGAYHFLTSPHCAHQGFVLGPHLALQCHVEMTEAMIREWCVAWDDERVVPGPSVQTPAEIEAGIAMHLSPMRAAADRLYARWISGLQTA